MSRSLRFKTSDPGFARRAYLAFTNDNTSESIIEKAYLRIYIDSTRGGAESTLVFHRLSVDFNESGLTYASAPVPGNDSQAIEVALGGDLSGQWLWIDITAALGERLPVGDIAFQLSNVSTTAQNSINLASKERDGGARAAQLIINPRRASLAFEQTSLALTATVGEVVDEPFYLRSGIIDRCTVSPELPEGIGLVKSDFSCTLQGVANEPQAQTQYEIRAIGAEGSSSVFLDMTLESNVTPPQLADLMITAVEQQPVAQRFSNTGGGVVQCSIEPALPQGLSISKFEDSCEITGRTSVIQDVTEYRVSATNEAGVSNSVLRLGISSSIDSPSLANKSLNLLRNTPVNSAFLNNGGPVETCAVTPSLPAGLVLSGNGGSCTLSGQATELSEQADYTVTTTNQAGSTTAILRLSVADTIQAPVLSGSDTANVNQYELADIHIDNTGGAAQAVVLAHRYGGFGAAAQRWQLCY